MSTADRCRVLITHSDPVAATGLVTMLSNMAGFEPIVGRLGEVVPEFVLQATVLICDCEIWRQVGLMPAAGVVVIARSARIFEIQRAIERGVLGYVIMGCDLYEVEGAVRAAAHRRRYLCRIAAQAIAGSLTAQALTARERHVLTLVADGRCNKVIASRLDIAIGTVKAHVRSIMHKLGASSRTDAARIATARGLLPEPPGDFNGTRTNTYGPNSLQQALIGA